MEATGLTATAPNLTLPDEAGPEDRLDPASALCSLGAQPHIMTAILLQILRDHFADPARIENPTLRKRLQAGQPWLATDNTGILLEAVGSWKPSTAEKRLGVAVVRRTWQLERKLIGDFADVDPYTGVSNYLAYWNGGHILACYGAADAETEILAIEVARLMLRFGPTIVEQVGLHRFRVVAIEARREIKEVSQHSGVPVLVEYVAEESWSITPDAPRLKRIEFSPDVLLGL